MTKLNYQMLVFDWDGTLADSKPLAISATLKTAEAFNYPLPPAELIGKYFGLELSDMLKTLFPDGDIPKMREVFYHHFEDDQLLFPGVLETLQYLKQRGFKLAVATNRILVRLHKALNATGLSTFFDALRTADHYGSKPDPAMLASLCEEFNLSPEQLVMIGDSPADMQLAANARTGAIAATYGKDDASALKEFAPVATLQHFTDLQQLF